MSQFNKYIFTLVLLFIAAISTAEMELIQHGAKFSLFPSWDWWTGNNWHYDNEVIQWLMRYPLSFLKDGWHFLKSSMLFSLMLALSIHYRPIKLTKSLTLDVFLFTIAFYIWTGVFFNIFYLL